MLRSLLAVLVIVLIAGLLLTQGERTIATREQSLPVWEGQPVGSLKIYCAASNRAVMSALGKDYLAARGWKLELEVGPSQALLAAAGITRQGDLYLPADDSYLRQAEQAGLLQASFPVARMHVVAVVAAGNPHEVATLDDFCRKNIRFVQANPELAAIGRLTRERLRELDQWDRLHACTESYVSSVTEAANAVRIGAADVALAYDVIARQGTGLQAVELEEFASTWGDVGIGILRSSEHSRQARDFVDFLLSDEQQSGRYREFGFSPPVPAGQAGADLP
jgi:molybdate transport system substrate-binding protein